MPLLLTLFCIRFCFEFKTMAQTTLIFLHFSWKIKHYLWCHPQDPSPPAPLSNICNQLCKTTQILVKKKRNGFTWILFNWNWNSQDLTNPVSSPKYRRLRKISATKTWSTRNWSTGLKLKAKQVKCLIIAGGSKDPIFWASALTLNSLVSNLIYWVLIRCVLFFFSAKPGLRHLSR